MLLSVQNLRPRQQLTMSWVGIGISSRYRFLGIPVGIFQVGSVFVVGISKYRYIGSVFHFASKRHVRILKFCFPISSQILTEDPCSRSRR